MRGPADRLVFYAGGSMWPTFQPGDRFVLEECDAAELRAGEVVVFGSGGVGPHSRLVAHRVLGVTERVTDRGSETWVRTQGDCSSRPDPEWPGERLVGRVVEVSPVGAGPERRRPRRLTPAPFLGWRLRHRLSVRRIVRGLRRRAAKLAGFSRRLRRALRP